MRLDRRMLGAFAAAALLAGPAPAQSQTAYPSRPIHLIVGFAAGGPTDVLARIIGGKLERHPGTAGGGREPHRRLRQHRDPIGRARAQRRLHHPDGGQQQRGQREPVQEPAVQVRRGPRAGRAAGGGADRAGRSSIARGQVGQRPDCARQVEARRDHVRHRRQGHHHASRGRAVQSHGRRATDAGAVQRAAARPPGTCSRARSR